MCYKYIFPFLGLCLCHQTLHCQPDFDKVIGERILKNNKIYIPGSRLGINTIEKVEVVSVDYYFESLPTVNYNLKGASYVPNDINLDLKKYPNCTPEEQQVTETYKITISLKKTISFTKSEVTSNKFSFGLKIPILSKAGEILLGDEIINSTTIGQNSASEQTISREIGRNMIIKIPPNNTFYLNSTYTRGTIRVPFDAHCKVQGTVKLKLFVKTPLGMMEPEVSHAFNDFLSEAGRNFDFEGYVTNENSSDLVFKMDQKPVDRVTDCLDTSTSKSPREIDDFYKIISDRRKTASLNRIQGITVSDDDRQKLKLSFKAFH